MRNKFITQQELNFYTGDSRKTFDRIREKMMKKDQSLVEYNQNHYELHNSILDERMSPHHKQVEELANYLVKRIGGHNETWARYLVNFNWKIFGTITFDTPKSLDSAKRYIDDLYQKTSKKYKVYSCFYVCELNHQGNHIHFVMDCRKEKVKTIIEFIETNINKKNVRLIEPYNIKKLGSSYLTKFLDKNPESYEIYNG